MEIREDDLREAAIQRLLASHLDDMRLVTPPESVHALDLEALRSPAITVWSAWAQDALLGCGALLELTTTRGEIKSMRTADAHRRRGVATAMLNHIVSVATQRGYAFLHLETGAQPAFAGARAFYERHGFHEDAPFGDYTLDPNSVFLTRQLRASTD